MIDELGDYEDVKKITSQYPAFDPECPEFRDLHIEPQKLKTTD